MFSNLQHRGDKNHLSTLATTCVVARFDRNSQSFDWVSPERRWSIHSFRYGCLVTTSPLSSIPPLSPLWNGTFGCYRLSWCDGRWVQDPRTYSPERSDLRLLVNPASRSRVADSHPNWDRFFGIGSVSRLGNPLYRPLYHVCCPRCQRAMLIWRHPLLPPRLKRASLRSLNFQFTIFNFQ